MEHRVLSCWNGDVSFPNRDRVTSKREMYSFKKGNRNGRKPLKVEVISHFEVVGAYFDLHLFPFLKTILDLASRWAPFMFLKRQ